MSDSAKIMIVAIISGTLLAFFGLIAQTNLNANKEIAKIGVACVEKGGDWDTHKQTCKM